MSNINKNLDSKLEFVTNKNLKMDIEHIKKFIELNKEIKILWMV